MAPTTAIEHPDRRDPVITPGARVLIRDAEWIVRRVDNAPGGFQLVCDGVDELVRGREAIFLTALEPPIQVLDPSNTELVPDQSAQFSDSILYMESQLRQAVPNDAEIHVGHTAAMDLVPYQLDPARPRWILLLSPSQILLLERGKWTHNRLLRFVLDDILGRRETATLQATAALLHRDCLIPTEGTSLLDDLDDNSHKHAFAVSNDLKYALRESIELIGNEAIRYRREDLKERIYRLDDKQLAEDLGRECLRYMYRLLFLFYIEARPELGYAPVNTEAYRKGYSLEHLRDLELVRLTGDESLKGYYIHESIQTLFRLIREGFDGGGDPEMLQGSLHNTFEIRSLDSALFRKGSTPMLDRVKMRNETLQQVIRLMSLTRPAKGRRGRRGRISYAQLGINQLGAVYEALLSYRGFFAEEDLYEVKRVELDVVPSVSTETVRRTLKKTISSRG